MFASKPGVGCGLAGMSFGAVHARDRDVDGDAQSIVIRLEPAHELTRTVQLPPGVQLLRAHVSSMVPWYPEATGGTWELPVPGRLVPPSQVVLQQSPQLTGLTARLRLSDPRAPEALVLLDPIVGEQMDSTRFDGTQLHTTTLRIVDVSGLAVPFAAIGFARGVSDSYCHLVERRIADANGQLVVRHGEAAAHLVVVDARGIAVAPLAPPAGDTAQQALQQVALQPLRWIELTAVDGARRPLRGARVVEGRVLGMATDPLAAMAAWQWLASLRADADGRLRLPLFDDGLAVKFGAGELRSDLVELRDTRARYLRLR